MTNLQKDDGRAAIQQATGLPPSPKPLWEEKRRERAQKCLARVLSEVDYDPKKQKISWVLPGPLGIRYDFRSLSASVKMGHKLAPRIRSEVLARMKDAGRDSLEEFECIYWEVLSEQKRAGAGASARWMLYLPIKLDVWETIEFPASLDLLGTTFEFMDDAHLRQAVGNEAFENAVSDSAIVRRGENGFANDRLFVAFCCHQGLSALDAWEKSNPVFDAFRGVLELTYGLGHVQFRSDLHPRRQVPMPRWGLAHSEEGKAELLEFICEDQPPQGVFPASCSYPTVELTEERFGDLRRNAGLLPGGCSERSTVALIADALRLYSQAMDAPFDYGCFLSLWQMIEVVTLHHSFKEVCPRLRKLLRSLEQSMGYGDLSEVLREFREKRNALVHKGIHFDIDQEDVNSLKLLCELALQWLISHRNDLKTKRQLEYFYEWATKGDAEIEAIEAALAYVKKDNSLGRSNPEPAAQHLEEMEKAMKHLLVKVSPGELVKFLNGQGESWQAAGPDPSFGEYEPGTVSADELVDALAAYGTSHGDPPEHLYVFNVRNEDGLTPDGIVDSVDWDSLAVATAEELEPMIVSMAADFLYVACSEVEAGNGKYVTILAVDEESKD